MKVKFVLHLLYQNNKTMTSQMQKFLINLACFTLGVVIVSCMYSEVVKHHQAQYDKCMTTQEYSIEWDCHCFKKWYLAKPIMKTNNRLVQ